MDKSGEDWRRICEITHCLTLPKLEREAHYRLAAKHRGDAAARALMEAVSAEWKRRQSANSSLF